MALALNTSHPLFGNIVAFVCPNEANDTIIDLKEPTRVITQVNGTFTFGSGAYGRSINSPNVNGSYLGLSPTILSGNRRAANYTVLVVANNTAALSGGGGNQPQYFSYGTNGESMTIDKVNGFLAYSPTPGALPTLITDADVLAAGSYSAAYTYSGTNNSDVINLYHNGIFKGTGTPPATSSTRAIDGLHSKQGLTWHTTEYAYIVVFDKVLTGTEISDLHASLGADNAFALLDTGGATAISFSGTIPTQSFTNGESVSVDLSSYFSGTQTPFTFAVTTGLLAGTGLTLSSSGVLSGTAALATQTGIVITGTDADTNTAVSNAFNITVNAAPTGNNISIADTLPSLSSAMSMTYTASSVGTITISDWANNTGTALPNLTGITVNVRSLVDGSTVYRTTTASTDANSDCVISDAAIVAGTSYEVTALKFNGVDYDIGIAIITAT